MAAIRAVRFSVSATDENVLRLSCCHVRTAQLHNDNGTPHMHGLLSPLMGPCAGDDGLLCVTCGRHGCCGHSGHIELQFPQQHPVFTDVTVTKLAVIPPA